MTEKDWLDRVNGSVEALRDYAGDEGMYSLVGISLHRADFEKRRVMLKTEWSAMTFSCLQRISKVFNTTEINFGGSERTEYPYSEYTPIPVHEGVITLEEVGL